MRGQLFELKAGSERVRSSRGKYPHSAPVGISFRNPQLNRASYHTSLLFPMIDSFPRIYNIGSKNETSLAVRSTLTTSTTVADRIRQIEQAVRRSVGVDEREALCDGLQRICEEYEEDWEDDSQDDDD